MALTKVRVPVSDIETISNGTSNVDIASSGADVLTTVSGTLALTVGNTHITIPAAIDLTALKIIGESVDLATTSGAAATIETDASKLNVGTTSAHPMQLLANAIVGLSIGTDGKTTLGVQGTGSTHLVNKSYVDAAVAATAAASGTISTTGTLTIATAGNDLILKWGIQNGSGQLTQVTFGTAFPNAIFVALACPTQNIAANSDGQFGVYNKQTTGFQINQANKGAATNEWNWIAIGY